MSSLHKKNLIQESEDFSQFKIQLRCMMLQISSRICHNPRIQGFVSSKLKSKVCKIEVHFMSHALLTFLSISTSTSPGIRVIIHAFSYVYKIREKKNTSVQLYLRSILQDLQHRISFSYQL